jgi:hypothetical protein
MFNKMGHSKLVGTFIPGTGIDGKATIRNRRFYGKMDDPETIGKDMRQVIHIFSSLYNSRQN